MPFSRANRTRVRFVGDLKLRSINSTIQILSAYTPVSAAQLNGNGTQRWNIPVVAPLHGTVTENGFTNIDGGADRAIPG